MRALIRSIRHSASEWWLVHRETSTPEVRGYIDAASMIGIGDIRFHARGGTALIFRGSVAGEAVAIKLPRNEEAKLSIRRECDVLAVGLPCVPRLRWRPLDRSFLVRDFARGERLDHFVKERGAMRLIGSLLQTARVLFPAVHESRLGNFVIRDFKPRNLVVESATEQLTLIDVGSVRREGGDATTTDAVARLGSRKWLFWSPEQLVGEPAIDRRSDYFSLGATAFFIVTGRAPYENAASEPVAAMAAYLRSYSAVVSEMRRHGLSSRFLSACLHPRADERPTTIEEIDD